MASLEGWQELQEAPFVSSGSRFCWPLAVAYYGIGDILTTVIGVGINPVTEIGPVAGPLLQQYGIVAFPVVKLALFTYWYVAWRVVPGPYSLAIPLGLAVGGVLVTVWNATILVTVLL